jgi:hypothetical protein
MSLADDITDAIGRMFRAGNPTCTDPEQAAPRYEEAKRDLAIALEAMEQRIADLAAHVRTIPGRPWRA